MLIEIRKVKSDTGRILLVSENKSTGEGVLSIFPDPSVHELEQFSEHIFPNVEKALGVLDTMYRAWLL